MINEEVAGVARAAAGELAPRYGPRLTAYVEAAIHADEGHQDPGQKAPGQYVDPIALGALIVAIAQFGYQVYTDHKKKGQQPTREQIAQAMRIERPKHSDLTGEETEVIDIISAKIIEHGGDKLPGWPSNRGSTHKARHALPESKPRRPAPDDRTCPSPRSTRPARQRRSPGHVGSGRRSGMSG